MILQHCSVVYYSALWGCSPATFSVSVCSLSTSRISLNCYRIRALSVLGSQYNVDTVSNLDRVEFWMV